MNNCPLKKYADYVSEKISTNQLNVSDYVTTDNILQNKQGITLASSLPAQSGKVTKYCTGDILLANIRPYLKKIWFSQKTGGCSADVLVFRAKENINPNFLYYALFRDDFFNHVMNGAKGTKMPRGDKTQIMEFSIPEFDKNIQNKIAQTLSCLDKKIELNNRINAELEAMAKTLYDYWFVQFDFPDANGKPYKTSGGKMVYNPTLKREIPDGWDVGALGQYLSFKRGISYTSQDIQDAGIPLINLNSFTLAGKFKYEGTKYFNGKYRAENLLSAGELVIAITDVTRNADIIGKAFVIPDIFQTKPLMSCDVASVSSARFGNSYLEQLFNSTHYHEYIKHFASGTLVLHLDLNGVNWFKSFIPPVELLAHYEATCEQLLKQRDIVIKENLLLKQLRDWLLPMLMNGQVTVNS